MEGKSVYKKCDLCDEEMFSKTSFYRHQKEGCRKTSNRRRGFNCLECGFAEWRIDSFVKLMKEFHSIDVKEEELKTFASQEGFFSLIQRGNHRWNTKYCWCNKIWLMSRMEQNYPGGNISISNPKESAFLVLKME